MRDCAIMGVGVEAEDVIVTNDPRKCDVCGAPATAHAVHLRQGRRSETHRCAAHDEPCDLPQGRASQLVVDSAAFASQAEFLAAMGLKPRRPPEPQHTSPDDGR